MSRGKRKPRLLLGQLHLLVGRGRGAKSAEASVALMRLRGRGNFYLERLRHFFLTHFGLSYQASQSGRQQPAIHTVTVESYPRCPTLLSLARTSHARRPRAPGSPYGGAIFLFDTLRVDRRLCSCPHVQMMFHHHFHCRVFHSRLRVCLRPLVVHPRVLGSCRLVPTPRHFSDALTC
jgi:hypothetical protein